MWYIVSDAEGCEVLRSENTVDVAIWLVEHNPKDVQKGFDEETDYVCKEINIYGRSYAPHEVYEQMDPDRYESDLRDFELEEIDRISYELDDTIGGDEWHYYDGFKVESYRIIIEWDDDDEEED